MTFLRLVEFCVLSFRGVVFCRSCSLCVSAIVDCALLCVAFECDCLCKDLKSDLSFIVAEVRCSVSGFIHLDVLWCDFFSSFEK